MRHDGNAWLISDLDGDDLPDLATSSSEGDRYKFEIHLSAGSEKASFTLTSSEPGICLLTCDLDQDNDHDLLIISARSLRPLEVWLNNGHGRFERGNFCAYVNFLIGENPYSYDHNSDKMDQASISENGPSPYDRSTLGSLLGRLEAEGSISDQISNSCLDILACRLTARSPPPNPNL